MILSITKFIQKVGFLSFFTLLSQALALASLVILRQLMEAEEFTKYVLIFTLVSVTSVLVSLKLETAISVSKSRRAVWSLFFTALAVSSFLSLIVLIPAHLWKINDFFYLIYALTFTSSVINVLQTTLFYFNNSRVIGIGRIIQASTTLAIFLFFTSAETELFVFISVILFSQLMQICYLLSPIYKMASVELFSFLKLRTSMIPLMSRTIRKQHKFVKYVMPEAFIGSLVPSLPFFLIDYHFSAKITADYAFCYKLIATPLSALSQSASGLLFPMYKDFSFSQLKRLFTGVVFVGFSLVIGTELLGLLLQNIVTEYLLQYRINYSLILFLFFPFAVMCVFNSMGGLHIFMELKELSLLFTILMCVAKLPLFLIEDWDLFTLLIMIFSVDMLFILALNLLCYRKIVARC